MHHVTIARLGPIESCEMDIPQFMILTGPQASGKSTIAKVIYYFRTVKDDILDIVLRAMSNENVEYHGTWQTRIKKQLRYKFLRIFGSSWAMPLDMEICYHYTATECIRLYLRQGNQTGDQNYIDFDFGPMLKAYIGELNQRKFDSGFAMLWQLDRERLEQLFDDPYETVFIPAGRSMITLLTDQINYIFTVMDELQRRTIDYCTQAYIERILKLKPSFVNGLEGLLSDKLHLTQDKVDVAVAKKALSLIRQILKGRYVYTGGEERLMLDDRKYVKINFTSSGQQETVWIFNILFYYLLENKHINLILEEPEAHLYPDSQKYMAELLGLFSHAGNPILVTTHSPYLLGEFNNLLYASEIPSHAQEKLLRVLDTDELLPYHDTNAFHVVNGSIEDGMEQHPGLIRNELIDGASVEINTECDKLMDLKWEAENPI